MEEEKKVTTHVQKCDHLIVQPPLNTCQHDLSASIQVNWLFVFFKKKIIIEIHKADT